MDLALGNRIIAVKDRVVTHFDRGNWEELGLLTGFSDVITGHGRLLRSLDWNDEDYEGNVLGVLRQIAPSVPLALHVHEISADVRPCCPER